MTPDELVEKVARIMCCKSLSGNICRTPDNCCSDLYFDEARAAIAIVLEEAAKVADARVDQLAALREDAPLGCGSLSWTDCNARVCEVEDIAAALRAMIPGGK